MRYDARGHASFSIVLYFMLYSANTHFVKREEIEPRWDEGVVEIDEHGVGPDHKQTLPTEHEHGPLSFGDLLAECHEEWHRPYPPADRGPLWPRQMRQWSRRVGEQRTMKLGMHGSFEMGIKQGAQVG